MEAINALRNELRKSDTEFQVVKNRLLYRASQDTDTAAIKEYMVGPSYSSSTASPAASGAPVVGKVGVNKMGMPYFESLATRLGIEEEEFFSKEEFDIEE